VVVKPEPIDETVGESPIYVPENVREKYAHAQTIGTLIATGPDAFKEYTTTTERYLGNKWVPFERTVTGFSEAFAKVGDRVAFAMYGGLQVEGADGETYRILNDMDITCRVDSEVQFTDIKSRKRLGEK
jgi:co-chaperonin GroES (HSP10)